LWTPWIRMLKSAMSSRACSMGAPSDCGMNDQTVGTWYRSGSLMRRKKLGITTDEVISVPIVEQWRLILHTAHT
jgi:hypothetical protein